LRLERRGKKYRGQGTAYTTRKKGSGGSFTPPTDVGDCRWGPTGQTFPNEKSGKPKKIDYIDHPGREEFRPR